MRDRLLPAALSVLCCSLHRSLCQEPHAFTLSGDYPVTHDPSIAREGNTYYVFATTSNPNEGQFPIRCSNDLQVMETLRPCLRQNPRMDS